MDDSEEVEDSSVVYATPSSTFSGKIDKGKLKKLQKKAENGGVNTHASLQE